MFQHVKNHLKDLNSGMELLSEHGVVLLLHSTILSSKVLILLDIEVNGLIFVWPNYAYHCC